ncbi:MAG: DNA polymerase III subunit gamma/tau [Pseudomonadota bacterium]
MTYLALARKWRPKAFSEVVGQRHVVQALSNALDSGRVHHAFLFTGTRGVGKTTLARIFAKSLNCEQGTSAEPCQQCSTCESIDQGRYVDLIEVDAASRTKVDDTRELLENIHYAPTAGKYKVFLIDEVHMLSGHSFNALLKTLEEPPEHVKFLFATTDPQKLPVTVLSRCLQFNLRAMRPEQIENQMVKILGQEGIESDQGALQAIAKAADGSMRDGLSLLDQAIAQGGGVVRTDDVQSMLGTIKTEHSDALLTALSQQDANQIMAVVADMADHAVDFSAAMDELLMQLYHLSLAQVAPSALAAKEADATLINKLAETLDAETVQLYYQIGLIAKRDIALAPSLRVGFEMAMLRMLAFEPAQEGAQSAPSGPGAQTSTGSAAESGPAPTKAAPAAAQAVAAAVQPEAVRPEAVQPAPAQEHSPQAAHYQQQITSAAEPQQAPSSPPPAPASNSPAPTPPAASQAAPQESTIAITLAGNNEWGELVEQSNLQGLSKELAMHCACEKLAPEKILLALAPSAQHLHKPERVTEIQQALQAVTNSQAEVVLEIEESDKETPAECLARLGYEQLEQTKQNLQNDPGVQALMSEFGATINEQSIKPLNQ